MRRHFKFFCLFFFLSCNNTSEKIDHQKLSLLREVVENIENEGNQITSDIKGLGDFYKKLLINSDTVKLNKSVKKYSFKEGYSSNQPDRDSKLSTVVIYNLNLNFEKALDEVEITNPLDSAFKEIMDRYELIDQIYSNSTSQVSRVYPAFDAKNLIELDLDVTAFNFYYEANKENNPSREPVWIPEIYLDPAGRGWIASLVHPVYFNDSLFAVLGIDFQMADVFESYMNNFRGDYIIITNKGDLVTGTARAIESLSLPPLKNHMYKETIIEDNFRISEFNLFNSKSREVRKMAQEILLDKKNNYSFDGGEGIEKALAVRFNLVDWYIIEIVK